jgi:hypothetical protein
VWGDCGGKVNSGDNGDPWRTALREYNEESLHHNFKWQPAQEDVSCVVWNSSGKYLLFVTKCPELEFGSPISTTVREKDRFAWVKGEELFARALSLPVHADSFRPMRGFKTPHDTGVADEEVVVFKFFLFSCRRIVDSITLKTAPKD